MDDAKKQEPGTADLIKQANAHPAGEDQRKALVSDLEARLGALNALEKAALVSDLEAMLARINAMENGID